MLENVDGRILITDIFDEGIVQRNGNFRIGDELVRVDGILLNGFRFAESLAILESQMNDLTKVKFKIKQRLLSNCHE